MKRKVLPVIIIAFSLMVVSGLIQAAQLQVEIAGRSPVPADKESVASGVSFTVDPLIQGRFAQAGETAEFEVTVVNTGSSPTDTYELEASSTWPAVLYGPDGSTPLIDTNGSGTVDTGIVISGQAFTIKARVETPPDEVIGDENMVELTITSSISPSLITTTVMQGAIPAPFVQTLYERSNEAMSLIMSQPNGAWQQQTTPDSWFDEENRFPELAVAETFSGYVYAWTRWWVPGTLWVSEVEYTLTDKAGLNQTQLTKVADHSKAGLNTYDEAPAVAVAPDGRIGIAWYRSIVQNELTENRAQNDNVYLVILDPAGNPITESINLTRNHEWWSQNSPAIEVPRFRAPRIAATRDNHFLVAWESKVMSYTGSITIPVDLNDIYYTVYDTDGLTATNVVNLTSNVLGQDMGSIRPAVSSAGADRILLSWNQRRPREQGGDDIFFTVIDSSGSTIEAPTKLSGKSDNENGLVDWSNFDVVELSDGDFIAAWQAYGCEDYPADTPRLRYAIIKGANYNRAGPPTCLPPRRQVGEPTIVAVGGDEGISLVADNEGRAILTWTDRAARDTEKRQKLYYALIDGNRKLDTYPMVFHQNAPGDDELSTGLQGYGSAPRIYIDAAIALDAPRFTGGVSQAAEFDINYSNLGVVTGTNLAITLALDPGLTYQSDNAPIAPSIQGSDVIWNLPQLRSLEHESFSVEVIVSDSVSIPHSFPLTATITVSGTEASLANNIDRAWLVVARPLYLPMIIKSE